MRSLRKTLLQLQALRKGKRKPTGHVRKVRVEGGREMRQDVELSITVWGDGETQEFSITHNFNIPDDLLVRGCPEVVMAQLRQTRTEWDVVSARPVLVARTANACRFTCAPFQGPGLSVRIRKPGIL